MEHKDRLLLAIATSRGLRLLSIRSKEQVLESLGGIDVNRPVDMASLVLVFKPTINDPELCNFIVKFAIEKLIDLWLKSGASLAPSFKPSYKSALTVS